MNILVTGANGFIGKRLCEQLIQEGHTVYKHTHSDGDIAEKDALDKYNEKEIQHVFHLAARTFVPASFENTYDYFRTNTLGTVTVLEFCRKNNASVTFMSTYVYGPPEYLPVDEKHPVKAMTPYHESKLAAEQICQYYSEVFNIKCVILRPFNVYGKDQDEAFLIPKILKQVQDESVKSIEVMDLEPKRDYIYINDLIKVMILTSKNIEGFEIYNVGSGESHSVEEVILDILTATKIEKPYISRNVKRKNEVMDCFANTDRLNARYGFVPMTSLIEGVKDMLEN